MIKNGPPHPDAQQAALAAARTLSATYGSQLRTEVLMALRTPRRGPDQYLDVISLASLIVSAATLAWTVYQDLRTKEPAPEHEAVARRVRLELPRDNTSPKQRDKIIEIVVEEVLNQDVGDQES